MDLRFEFIGALDLIQNATYYEMCDSTQGFLLHGSSNIPNELANRDALILTPSHIESLGTLVPDKILREKCIPTAALLDQTVDFRK